MLYTNTRRKELFKKQIKKKYFKSPQPMSNNNDVFDIYWCFSVKIFNMINASLIDSAM